ncbi:MinD/ParA family protein [Thermococcus sp.]|uniref:tyrosine-protein kinase family protein n=1 Tax=Thermococcus sp. TaxID=35749 RepID=UPI002618CA52|nr:MinD/ParA family protein [Thermococcus sp.]
MGMRIIGFLGPGGSGKTTVSANVATCLAIGGVRTLLIDGDLYLPDLHNHFALSAPYSFEDYLNDPELNPEWLTVPAKFSRNLHIILGKPQGITVNPLKLLSVLDEIIDRLKTMYGVIVIDFPPLIPIELKDLLKKVDIPVLVVDPNRVPLDVLFDYISTVIKKFGADRLILNFADFPEDVLGALVGLTEEELGVHLLASIPTRESLLLEPVRGFPACLEDEWLSELGLTVLEELGYI